MDKKEVHKTVILFLKEESPCTLVTNQVNSHDIEMTRAYFRLNFDKAIKDIQFVDSDVDVHYVQLKFI